jgi:hypothetical protein
VRKRTLRRRYGRASSYSTTSHDLGNNESYSIGISKFSSEQSKPWLAITGTQSQWFKTFRGAEKWLAKRGYDAHGKKIR